MKCHDLKLQCFLIKMEKCINKRELRIGEMSISNSGRKMKIIEYRTNKDIDVEFIEDGYIKNHICYTHFKNGKVKHKNDHPSQRKYLTEEEINNRIGQISINKGL